MINPYRNSYLGNIKEFFGDLLEVYINSPRSFNEGTGGWGRPLRQSRQEQGEQQAMSIIYINVDAMIKDAEKILDDVLEDECVRMDEYALAHLMQKCVYEEYFLTMDVMSMIKDITT